MALLIAPLFTAGIAVGGIQNANAGGPTTLFVDEDGMADAGSCDNATGAFNTIQSAIDAAISGDTIVVCPHDTEYAEAVEVNVAGITVEGIEKPKVDGTGLSPAFTITENGVVLSGFEAISGDTFCIFVNANDVRIHGNIANGCGNHGINVIGDDNTISGNIVNLNDGAGIVIDGDDNTIRGNKVNGNDDGNGIRINGNDNTIQGNIANGNDSNGIFLGIDSDRNLVKGNTVNGNNNNGIDVRGDDNTISSNTLNNNGADGIRIDGSSGGNDVTHNTTNENGDDGIDDNGAGNTFDKNRCRNNGTGSEPLGLCSPQGNP